MKEIETILHEGESVLVNAEIANTFYKGIVLLYLLGAALFAIGYEYEIGIIGVVLILRTAYVHYFEIKEKASYHCVLTEERLIIHKGYQTREIFPIPLEEIRTIYIKPINPRLKRFIDVGTLEVVTTDGGRYVIRHVKKPYVYHKAIIGDIVAATNYEKQKKKKFRQ